MLQDRTRAGSWSVGIGGGVRNAPARAVPWLAVLLLAVPTLAPAACSATRGSGASADASGSPFPAPVQVSVPAQWKFHDVLEQDVARSTGGMVATDDRLATDVGIEVLDQGGSAADAAVATAFALAVTHPAAGNIGGGGFAVVRLANGEVASLDFRERAPLAASRDMYLDEAGEVTKDSILGHRAVGVPGSVAGLWKLHERYGTLTWQQVLAPAIRLARDGFVADAQFARAAADQRFARFAGSKALFWPGGEPVQEGQRWSNPDLANVLERISEQGPKAFYEGKTADLIVAEMERGGGLITHRDLRQYEAKWRDPVVFEYRGYQVVSMPPPSSGGLTLALIAHIVEGWNLRELGWHSTQAMHRVIEAMRRAFAERNYWLGDPDFVSIPSERFLSDEAAARQRESIDLNAATPSASINPGGGSDGSESRHTTHFSVVDAQGNAVALTTTINHGNGSGVVVTGAGFLLNNEMDDFASKPGSPNAFGLVQGEANAIEPGKRMLSAMSPTVVVKDGRAVLVTGASGGPTIITGVFQILSNAIDFGLGIGPAVRLPRFHQQHLPDVLRYEDGGFTSEQIEALEALGHHPRPARFRIATGASLRYDGTAWTGTHDPRALGSARGQ